MLLKAWPWLTCNHFLLAVSLKACSLGAVVDGHVAASATTWHSCLFMLMHNCTPHM